MFKLIVLVILTMKTVEEGPFDTRAACEARGEELHQMLERAGIVYKCEQVSK